MQAKLRCAIYTRVSTDNQVEVEFNSCEAQEEKIKSFVKSQENMQIFKVYSDPGYTGANLNRPALQEMLNDIKEHKINLVISYKIDRLTRSPKDFYQLIELFDRHGVDFISVTERFDTSTPSGRLLRNIMLTFAQFERELTSERTKDKMLERANKGMWNGGLVPFGYRVENKKLVIKKEDAKIIKNIFDAYISSGSLISVCRELKGSHSKSHISYILRNIIYTGRIKYAGKIYHGNHQPIISDNVFNLAQEIHKQRIRNLRVYKDYSLAGLLNCKSCNSFMTPCHTNKKRHNRLHRYYYYRCTKTFKKDWNSCDIRQVSADRLEDFIFENLERISVDRHYIDSLIFKLNNSQTGDRIGLELPRACSESLKISAEIFEQTLCLFVKGLFERKGIEKNLWAKKFIKRIIYCKEEIAVSFYYKSSSEEAKDLYPASGRVGAAAGRKSVSLADKKITPISTDRGNHQDWLRNPETKRFMRSAKLSIPIFLQFVKGKLAIIEGNPPYGIKTDRRITQALLREVKPVIRKPSPLEEAYKYAEVYKEPSIVSKVQIAERFGVSRARVCQMLNLLELDENIRKYLLSIKDTKEHNYFTERKLREIAIIKDKQEQLGKFAELVNDMEFKLHQELD